MTWKFVGDKKGLEPLPGLPLEASDAEFDAALQVFEQYNAPGAAAAVKASGLYQQTKDKTATAAEEN